LRGIELYHQQKWSASLVQLREASAARDDPVIQFNIGLCERSLGHYVAARRAFQLALSEVSALDERAAHEAEDKLKEVDELIVRLSVLLDPAGASLTVDDRLLIVEESGPDSFLAGIASAPGMTVHTTGLGPSFTLLLDPGAHIFRASRPAHRDGLINATYAPGPAALELKLDLLQAQLRVESTPRAAIIKVSGHDVGPTPAQIQRAPGKYTIEARLDGYDTFETTIELAPGDRETVLASLSVPSLWSRWWFWGSVMSGLALAGGITYRMTRPEPEPPPYDSGNTGWVVETR
jgi:hypothetical protein